MSGSVDDCMCGFLDDWMSGCVDVCMAAWLDVWQLLERFWELPGRFSKVLGRFWMPLGRFWGPVGAIGALLEIAGVLRRWFSRTVSSGSSILRRLGAASLSRGQEFAGLYEHQTSRFKVL